MSIEEQELDSKTLANEAVLSLLKSKVTAELKKRAPPTNQQLQRVQRIATVACALSKGQWHVRQNGRGAWTEIWRGTGGKGGSRYIASYTEGPTGERLAEFGALLSPEFVLSIVNECLQARKQHEENADEEL